jgi:hypothetical protein
MRPSVSVSDDFVVAASPSVDKTRTLKKHIAISISPQVNPKPQTLNPKPQTPNPKPNFDISTGVLGKPRHVANLLGVGYSQEPEMDGENAIRQPNPQILSFEFFGGQ